METRWLTNGMAPEIFKAGATSLYHILLLGSASSQTLQLLLPIYVAHLAT
jgi:hypothetical protein